MKQAAFAIGVLLLLAACHSTPPTSEAGPWPQGIRPPVAVQKPHQRMLFGDTVSDNYYWMIDYFSKGPDSTLAVDYLRAENAYLDTMMSGTRGLQQRLFAEMKARIKEDDADSPSFKNGFYYYTRKEKGQQYFKYCRKKKPDAPEELLLDIDQLSQGHPFFSIGDIQRSPDIRFVAYSVDIVSRRQYMIYVKDLRTGAL